MITADLFFGVAAALAAACAAWLAADRWARREELNDLHGQVLVLSHRLATQELGNRELASFVAVVHELVAIHNEADRGSMASRPEWLGGQVQSHLRELLSLGWDFEADLENGGFSAEREL